MSDEIEIIDDEIEEWLEHQSEERLDLLVERAWRILRTEPEINAWEDALERSLVRTYVADITRDLEEMGDIRVIGVREDGTVIHEAVDRTFDA